LPVQKAKKRPFFESILNPNNELHPARGGVRPKNRGVHTISMFFVAFSFFEV
jgi:hypothetical protein